MLELLSSGGLSGLFGLAGGLCQRFIDLKLAKEKFKFMEVKMKYRLQEIIEETKGLLKLEEIKTEGEIEKEMIQAQAQADKQASKDLRAAYSHDKRAYSTDASPWYMKLVDFFRGVIRPAITIWTLYLLQQITTQLSVLAVVETLNSDLQFELVLKILEAIISLTFLTVGFWFGQRGGGAGVNHSRRAPKQKPKA